MLCVISRLFLLVVWCKCTYALSVSCFEELDGALFPNADNSTWYFECQNGSLLLRICPILHVYHKDLKQCIPAQDILDPVFNVPQNQSTEVLDEIYSVTESMINFTVPIFTNTLPADEPSADLIGGDNPCPCQDSLSPTYFASRDECDKYFMCYRSRPLELSCCRDQHWSQTHKKCVPQYMSSCGIRPEPAAINMPSCPARGCAVYPHLTVCEYFYYCEEGVRSIQQCDAFYHFDFYAQRCVVRSEAKCITSIPNHLRSQMYI